MTKDNPYHNNFFAMKLNSAINLQISIISSSKALPVEVASKLGLCHWGWIFRFPISWGYPGSCQQPVTAAAHAYVQFGGHHINSGAGTHSYFPTEQGKHCSSASWAAASAGFLILNPFVLSNETRSETWLIFFSPAKSNFSPCRNCILQI